MSRELRSPTRIGKSEARTKFLPLVEAAAHGAAPVEITDRGEVAAVLLGYKEYLWLLTRAKVNPAGRTSPVGTMRILEDLENVDSAAFLLEPLEVRASRL